MFFRRAPKGVAVDSCSRSFGDFSTEVSELQKRDRLTCALADYEDSDDERFAVRLLGLLRMDNSLPLTILFALADDYRGPSCADVSYEELCLGRLRSLYRRHPMEPLRALIEREDS